MFITDIPAIYTNSEPLMAVHATDAKSAAMDAERTLGVCHIIPNSKGRTVSAANLIQPDTDAAEYLRLYDNRAVKERAEIVILHPPRHGTLREAGEEGLMYEAAPGYFGNDQATILAKADGVNVKIMYFFQVIDRVAIGDTTYERLCGKRGYSWKISSTQPR